MQLRRWSPLTIVFPDRYVDRSDRWTTFDFETWSDDEYEWEPDPWNGLRDFAQRPTETVETGTGDCEDYALVALSWAIANDRDGVGMAFCWETPYPWPQHVIAYDDERVYSSGHIRTETVGEWLEDSQYHLTLRRRVS